MKREFPLAPMVAVGAVILDGNRVLLVRRAGEPLAGEWSVPGGVVELGETLAVALRREVLEETGLEVDPLAIVEALSSIVVDPPRVRYHYVVLDYLCQVAGGSLACGSDASEARWVRRQDLGSGRYGLTKTLLAVVEKAFEMRTGRGG